MPDAEMLHPYQPHSIEAESFRIISGLRDWSIVPREQQPVMQRLVHTAGAPGIVEGGSPWASSAVNALMILAHDERVAERAQVLTGAIAAQAPAGRQGEKS